MTVSDNAVKMINLERQNAPQVSMSPRYHQMLNDPNLDEASKTFLKAQQERAKEIMECIENRYRILDHLAEYLADFQADYFRYGTAYLRPLLQKDLAKKMNVSASTISRIVTSKYFILDSDTYVLKTLTPRSYFGKTIEQLKRLISDLFARFPNLSDQKITTKCHQMGIRIARRTIAKYRSLNNIPARYIRQQPTDPNENRPDGR